MLSDIYVMVGESKKSRINHATATQHHNEIE